MDREAVKSRGVPLNLYPQIARQLIRRFARPFRVAWRRSWLYRRLLKGKMPDRILFHPFDGLPRRLEEADLLLKGRFRFGQETVEVKEGSVFDKPAPSDSWSKALHGFAWLPPLSAAGGEPSRILATNLISQWIRRNARYAEPAWSADVMAERLLLLFAHGRFVTANSDVMWRSKLLVSLREQSRLLARSFDEAPEGLPRLSAAVAHVLSGACLNDSAKRLETGLAHLEEQIVRQILPDGGHITRSPEALLHAYRLTVMAVDALTATDRQVPASIRSAHDRMAPMLRFFRHGDGGLALFNGGSECDRRMIEALLARDDIHGQPFQHAPHSGYQRMIAGKTLAIMDCGSPPPGEFSLRAHAGCLAFELSSGPQRIVVNCGDGNGSLTWESALRSTAAHSTVTLADTSVATVLQPGLALGLLGARLLGGSVRVETTREEISQGCRVDARHNGYLKPFGVTHERSLSLSPRGNALSGVDRLLPAVTGSRRDSVPYAVRFHIHPDVRVSPSQGTGFILKLPGGEGWRFRCSAETTIEESVYVGTGSVRRAEQIVIAGAVKDTPVEIGWAFEQMPAG
ncbi:MAG: heparinase II/III family protein [Rhizomicrobium sp.]